MTNYREKPGSGIAYRRSCGGKFYNDYELEPVIEFDEEDITLLVVDGKETVYKKATGKPLRAVLNVSTAGKTFPLIHPETGELLGGYMTRMNLFIAVRSFWASLAAERDAAEAEEAARLAAIAAAEGNRESPAPGAGQ
jgi:hypothetical protein